MTTLIEFLVNELPKRGGWPRGAAEAYRHVSDDFPSFYDEDGGSVSREYGRSLNLCSVDLNLDDDEFGETVTREQYESALSANKPEWNGDGLPPVGCECEARYRYSSVAEWVFFRCVAVDCEVAFGWTGKKPVTLLKDNFEFRPIRSSADKKKEAVLSQIANAIIGDVPDTGMATAAMYAERIYEAIKSGKIVID